MSENLSTFFEMGGHGAYIWPVYGLAVVMMLGILLHSLKSWRNNEAELKLLQNLHQKPNITLEEGQ